MIYKLDRKKILKIIKIDNAYYRNLFLLKSLSINLVISLETFNLLEKFHDEDALEITKVNKEIKELVNYGILVNLNNHTMRFKESLYIWLHLTDQCNLNCGYCYIPSLHSKNKIVDGFFEQLSELIVKDKSKYNEVNLKLAGGEPFLTLKSWEKDFDLFVEKMQLNDIKLYIRIITNLTVINDAIISFIKKYKIQLSFSIDSLNEENSRNFYQKDENSSTKVLKNIEKLSINEIKPSAMVTIDESNYKNTHELISYLLSNDITFRISDAKQEKNIKNEFKYSIDQMLKLINNQSEIDKDIKYKFLVSDLNTLYPKAEPCSMGKYGAAIYMNGDIYFCHTELGSDKKLGNIWTTESLDETIKSGYYNHLNLHEDCDYCEFRAICAGGCPLYRVNGKSPQCSTYQYIIKNVIKVYENCN